MGGDSNPSTLLRSFNFQDVWLMFWQTLAGLGCTRGQERPHPETGASTPKPKQTNALASAETSTTAQPSETWGAKTRQEHTRRERGERFSPTRKSTAAQAPGSSERRTDKGNGTAAEATRPTEEGNRTRAHPQGAQREVLPHAQVDSGASARLERFKHC